MAVGTLMINAEIGRVVFFVVSYLAFFFGFDGFSKSDFIVFVLRVIYLRLPGVFL